MLIAIIILIGVLLVTGCKKALTRNPAELTEYDQIMSNRWSLPDSNERKLTRREIEDRLAALARETPEVVNPPPSLAMCYAPLIPIDRAEYVCPVCGEKTIYRHRKQDERYLTDFVINTIPTFRIDIKYIKGLDVRLDETQYCSECSPDVGDPNLALVVTYPSGATHRTEGVTAEDIKLLIEFTHGKKIHESEEPGPDKTKTPLNEHLKRLSDLLGVPYE